ncbi:MAG TPA: TlpA disulfide reductase family protein [Pirellulaceae bacterium]|nr:TlpA disulfide reductase family protein [Pirellulaceae bacterium]
MGESSFSQSSDAERAVAAPERRGLLLWPWIALLVAFALFLFYRFNQPGAGDTDAVEDHPAIGSRIEQVQLAPLTGDGPPVRAVDLQGKVTLMNFWGPWCGPCRIEFPHIQAIEQHYRNNREFQFLSISYQPPGSDEDIGPWTAEFLAEFDANFPTYHDPGHEFLDQVRQIPGLVDFGFPTSFVLDRQGIIRGVWMGYAPGMEREIQQVIEKTLRETPAKPVAGPAKP